MLTCTSNGWGQTRSLILSVIDSWSYACLIHEVFDRTQLRSSEQLYQMDKIPQKMAGAYRDLINPNLAIRTSMSTFLDCDVFITDFAYIANFMGDISIKDIGEKSKFYRHLTTKIETLPKNWCCNRLLPELVSALQYGNATPAILPLIIATNQLHGGGDVPIPHVMTFFASPDRALRLELLSYLPQIIKPMDQKTLVEIWGHIETGFSDNVPAIREGTLKAILHLMDKLPDKIINGDLIKHLGKLQTDPEPGIRTNTTICLGKLNKNLSDSTRKRVMLPAFTRATQDPFPPARGAALMAFSATADNYSPMDIASKILPCIVPLLLDTDKTVRTQAAKCVENFLSKTLAAAAAIPDVEAAQPIISSSGVPPVTNTEEKGDYTGWGKTVNTLAKKLNIKDQTEPVLPTGPTILAQTTGFLSFEKEVSVQPSNPAKGMSLGSNKNKSFAAFEELTTPNMSTITPSSAFGKPRKDSVTLANSFTSPTVNYPSISAPPKWQNTASPQNTGWQASNTGAPTTSAPSRVSQQSNAAHDDWGDGWDDMDSSRLQANVSLLQPMKQPGQTHTPSPSQTSWPVLKQPQGTNQKQTNSNTDWGAW